MKLPTLADAIDELGREIILRKRIYPRWIQDGRLKAEKAAHRIACIDLARENLIDLQDDRRRSDSLPQSEQITLGFAADSPS